MSLNFILWLFGAGGEAALLGLLLYRRVWRDFPVFCTYVAWTLLSDIGGFAITHHSPDDYRKVYFAIILFDSALQLAILAELSWSLLRPIRAALTRVHLLFLVGLILAIGALIWRLASIPGFATLNEEFRLIVSLQQTTSILRVLFFLVLVACGQLLAIGWKDRELQIATGLGFYSLVSLVVEMMHAHMPLNDLYKHLNRLVVVSYLCSLTYWLFCFAHKEVRRQEFSPKMMRVLTALAGNARTTKLSLNRSSHRRGGENE